MVNTHELGLSAVADAGGFFEALDAVDRQGWDGPAGSALLEYARTRVVEPCLNRRGLFGEARECAAAAGWLAAWHALRAPAIRTAASPWGLVQAAVTRGIKGEFIAARYHMSTRQAWRCYAAGIDPIEAPAPVTISLDQELARGRDVAEPHHPVGLGARLESIRDALVGVGWPTQLAEDALDWCAANYSGCSRAGRDRAQSVGSARTPSGRVVSAADVRGHVDAWPVLCCPGCNARLVAGWHGKGSAPFFRLRAGQCHGPRCVYGPAGRVRGCRSAAAHLRLPEWRLRRLALLVGGGLNHVGLLELLVSVGPGVFGHEVIQRCLLATASRWATCPSAMLAESYGTRRELAPAA